MAVKKIQVPKGRSTFHLGFFQLLTSMFACWITFFPEVFRVVPPYDLPMRTCGIWILKVKKVNNSSEVKATKKKVNLSLFSLVCSVFGLVSSYSSRWWQLKYFLVSPLPGKIVQFDEHIFQLGWFNHQLVTVIYNHPSIPLFFCRKFSIPHFSGQVVWLELRDDWRRHAELYATWFFENPWLLRRMVCVLWYLFFGDCPLPSQNGCLGQVLGGIAKNHPKVNTEKLDPAQDASLCHLDGWMDGYFG